MLHYSTILLFYMTCYQIPCIDRKFIYILYFYIKEKLNTKNLFFFAFLSSFKIAIYVQNYIACYNFRNE